MPRKPPDRPPVPLLDAFRSLEQASDIAVLMADEEGFDARLIRVLSTVEKVDQRWDAPSRPCPDEGRPTAAAWAWLVSGWWIDLAAISVGANISRDLARERIALLQQARLIYPDGSISAHARKAIGATVAQRLRSGGGKKKKDEKKDEEKAN